MKRMIALLMVITLGAGLARAGERDWIKTTVFQSHDEALTAVFAGADSTWTEDWTPTRTERTALVDLLGETLPEESFTFHRGRFGDQDMGWALILDEIGLHEPITHLVKVDADGKIEEVRVLVYRETRGDAVKRPRFLQQFRGKSSQDRLALGRDLDAVTGATYSSKAIVRGVRKTLTLMEFHYPTQFSQAISGR